MTTHPPIGSLRYATVEWRGKQREIVLEVVDDKGHELSSKAAFDFRAMVVAAKGDGVDIIIVSATREQRRQRQLYAAYLLKKQRLDEMLARGEITERKHEERQPTVVAPPGRSLHEIGEAVDVRTNHDGGRTHRWLEANAHRFGFVRDVPGERWHLSRRKDLRAVV